MVSTRLVLVRESRREWLFGTLKTESDRAGRVKAPPSQFYLDGH